MKTAIALNIESQSHRTDQGSSKETQDPGSPTCNQKSQSHRTDQGNFAHHSEEPRRGDSNFLREFQVCHSKSEIFTVRHAGYRGPRAAAPSGLGRCFESPTRGRRYALTPGYMLSPLRGSQRNDCILLYSVLRAIYLQSEGARMPEKSQSHRTDQGSSKVTVPFHTEALMPMTVAIPPYRSGQFQVSGRVRDDCRRY